MLSYSRSCKGTMSDALRMKWAFYSGKSRGRFLNRPKLMAALCRTANDTAVAEGREKPFSKSFGFHTLRHYSASYLAHRGVPIIVISKLLRHRSVATTERYLHGVQAAWVEAAELLAPISQLIKQPAQERASVEYPSVV